MNNRTDPEKYGVPGGKNYKDGSIEYVGYGDATKCSKMKKCPGYISTKKGSAGCYMACQATKKEFFDATSAYYLAW